MILGVDLDGVCGDYTKQFRNTVAYVKQCHPSALTLDVSWDYGEWGIADRDEFLQLHGLAVTNGLFLGMEAMEGVSEALWHLSDNDVWNRIITHRLGLKGSHQLIAGDTLAWLEREDIPYRDLCFLGDKPQVDADVYVEDAPHNVENLKRQGKDVIIFDQPYNRHIDGFRAHNWSEVVDLLGY